MRGASALESVIEQVPDKKMRVFIVWMPVLATDIGPPSTATMARVADRRVAQFWDPKRAISTRFAALAHAHPDWLSTRDREEITKPDFIVWDFVAVWKPGARWETEPPRPDYHGDPVVRVIDPFRDALLSFLQ